MSNDATMTETDIVRFDIIDGEEALLSSIRLPGTRAEVFDFFGDANNLEAITPKHLHFHILTPSPIDMKPGTLIDYKLRLRGIPIRWRTRISVWEPPIRFVDEQLRGPYKLWEHEHIFEEDGDHTIIHDRVRFRSPLAFLTHPLLIRSDLRKIFTYRFEQLTRIFKVSPAEAIC